MKKFIKKETLAQVFSCEFCEISKNTFFHRTPLVAASDNTTRCEICSKLIITHQMDIFISHLNAHWVVWLRWSRLIILFRDGLWITVVSTMKLFLTILHRFYPSTIIAKASILNSAGVLYSSQLCTEEAIKICKS